MVDVTIVCRTERIAERQGGVLLHVHLADDLVVAGPAEGLPIVVARQLVLVTRLPTSPLQRPTSLWRRCVGATLLFTTLPPTPTGFPLAGGEEARPPLRLLPMLLVRQEEGRALRGLARSARTAPTCCATLPASRTSAPVRLCCQAVRHVLSDCQRKCCQRCQAVGHCQALSGVCCQAVRPGLRRHIYIAIYTHQRQGKSTPISHFERDSLESR